MLLHKTFAAALKFIKNTHKLHQVNMAMHTHSPLQINSASFLFVLIATVKARYVFLLSMYIKVYAQNSHINRPSMCLHGKPDMLVTGLYNLMRWEIIKY